MRANIGGREGEQGGGQGGKGGGEEGRADLLVDADRSILVRHSCGW